MIKHNWQVEIDMFIWIWGTSADFAQMARLCLNEQSFGHVGVDMILHDIANVEEEI